MVDNFLHGRHGYAGTRVSSISFSPQSGHCLWLGVKVKTTLAVKVHVTQNGSSATSLQDNNEHMYPHYRITHLQRRREALAQG